MPMERQPIPALSVVLLAALALGGVLAGPARAESVHERLVAAQADSVVSVKYVLNIRVSGRGQSRDMEQSGTATGVLVDPVGLVVVPSDALAPTARMPGIELTATPSSLRVVFPGDPKEYDAVLGATDTRLGLAFVRIKDLAGKAVRALDLANSAEPQVGTTVYGVSRLPQGFDYAPYCDTVDVVAAVTKPRKMWFLQGRFTEAAHPLFDAEGRCLGLVVQQEGVGERLRLPFLLPLGVVKSTIERAAREAEKVLEEAAKEAPPADGTPPGGTPPKDGPPPGEAR